jgi:hypothetical protein
MPEATERGTSLGPLPLQLGAIHRIHPQIRALAGPKIAGERSRQWCEASGDDRECHLSRWSVQEARLSPAGTRRRLRVMDGA